MADARALPAAQADARAPRPDHAALHAHLTELQAHAGYDDKWMLPAPETTRAGGWLLAGLVLLLLGLVSWMFLSAAACTLDAVQRFDGVERHG